MPYFRLFLTVVLLLGAITAFLVGKVPHPTNKGQTIDVRRYGVVGLLGGLLFLALACVRIVPANTVGIPTTFGAIGSPVRPGLKLVTPFTEVNTFSTRLQESTMLADVGEGDRKKEDSIEVRGSDGYAMNVDLTIRFAVRPDAASTLYRRVGDMAGIRDRIVRPETREGVRVVFGNFTAEEGYTAKREQISAEVNQVMQKRLEPYGLDLDQVNVRNVNPEESLRKAIGDRAAARERANQAQIEQQKQVTEAETRKQVAERDAQARQISAQAEAEANAKIAASLTDPLLRKLYFEALAKGNTIYVPNDGSVIIDGRQQTPPAPRAP